MFEPITRDIAAPLITKGIWPLVWFHMESALAHRPDLDAVPGKFRVIDAISANRMKVDTFVGVFADLVN